MEKTSKIKLLMDTTGALMDVETEFKAAFPLQANEQDLAEDPDFCIFYEKVKAKFAAVYPAFQARQIEIYAKYLSDETLDASIVFYASPEGNAIARAMPRINAELNLSGETFAKELSNEIVSAITGNE